MNNRKTYHVIGLMSGSSLDGLDIAYCKIKTDAQYKYEIIASETIPFTEKLLQLLKNFSIKNADLQNADDMFGDFCGEQIVQFMHRNALLKPDYIASHGHTVSHHPELGFSKQIGNPKKIFDHINIPVIYDFRNADIRAGGQGAPLVPICDEILFNDYSFCVNIGGIANISFKKNGVRLGYDICGANQILNFLANQLGFAFDDGGKIASKGIVHDNILQALNTDAYLKKPFPKSLDNSYVKNHFINLLNNFTVSLQDKMATVSEHIAQQISNAIITHTESGIDRKILITGGGTFNATLVKRIAELTDTKITLPDNTLIQFKEALAMALMGVLRIMEKPNCLPSVTGASVAVCGGEIIS